MLYVYVILFSLLIALLLYSKNQEKKIKDKYELNVHPQRKQIVEGYIQLVLCSPENKT